MASLELRKLWRLHTVDAALLEIRQRAAALDPGKAIMARIAALEKEYEEKGGAAKALHAELKDVELQRQTAQDKIKKFDKELYSGKVVNPREVEAIEKEIAMLKRRMGEWEEQWLELSEKMTPAAAIAEEVEKRLNAEKTALREHQKKAVATKTQLESEFKRFSAARPEALKEVDKVMLAKYDAIKARLGGLAMADAKTGSCSVCGTRLPERALTLLREDKVVVCEQCHRILYLPDGLI